MKGMAGRLLAERGSGALPPTENTLTIDSLQKPPARPQASALRLIQRATTAQAGGTAIAWAVTFRSRLRAFQGGHEIGLLPLALELADSRKRNARRPLSFSSR